MATTNIYYPLISATQLKSLISEINDSISNDYIDYVIKVEQVKNIRQLLGYSYYNQIQSGISGDTLSNDDQIIYDDYLKMILSLYCYKRLILSMTYQLENAGLRKKFSDVSEIAETGEIKMIRSEIQDDIDFYKKEMVKYICENPTLYPLYYNDTDSRYNSLNDNRIKGPTFGFNISSIHNGGYNRYGKYGTYDKYK